MIVTGLGFRSKVMAKGKLLEVVAIHESGRRSEGRCSAGTNDARGRFVKHAATMMKTARSREITSQTLIEND